MSLKVKTLDKLYIPQILELEQKHSPSKDYYVSSTLEEVEYIFDHPEWAKGFGIFDGENLIGWSAYRGHEGKRFEISPIFVHTDYRGKKLGKRLFTLVIEDIEKNHEGEMYLSVSPKNTSALVIYLKADFQIYDFKKDYFGPGTDRILMRKWTV